MSFDLSKNNSLIVDNDVSNMFSYIAYQYAGYNIILDDIIEVGGYNE